VLAFAAAPAAGAVRAALHVTPSTVRRGYQVTITGIARGGCPAGDQVTIISRAFSARHEFAGVPAVFTRTRSNGTFRTVTRIPARRRPGRYAVNARCGGGTLPVTAHLTVTR